jgi:hypothetical protein
VRKPVQNIIPSKVADPYSVAAFATAILLVGYVPVILGIVGIRRTARPEWHGRWMAVVGVTFGGVVTIAWSIVLSVLAYGLLIRG